jgi:7-carboxy-7-deazaguanine synthase
MFLQLIELFESVQGETSFSGCPTTFIRLAACNLRCTWCDTTYSFKKGVKVMISTILEQVSAFGHKYVCVTGGEPLLQKPVHSLMKNLVDLGFTVSLETSGSLPINEVDPRVHIILDVKCPQSGMESKNLWENLSLVTQKDEIKFVIQDRADFDYALTICDRYNLFAKSPVLFSPVFGKIEPRALVEWMLQEKCPARLNMQIHKFIWTPATRGV